MPLGINSTTAITMANVTSLGNVTNPVEFLVKVDHVVYSGYMFFIMFWVLAIIIFMSLQSTRKQFMVNAMHSMAVVAIVSLLFRAAEVTFTDSGVVAAFLTDPQNYMFPLIAAILAAVNWGSKKV